MAEISSLFAQRPIVLRHQKAALYHPFIEAVALTLVDLPITLTTTGVFAILIYFIVGLQQSAGQFLLVSLLHPSRKPLIHLSSIFYLFLATMSITMKAFFRAIAAAFKSPATAQSVAGIVLLMLVLYTGYTIPKPVSLPMQSIVTLTKTFASQCKYFRHVFALMTNMFSCRIGALRWISYINVSRFLFVPAEFSG